MASSTTSCVETYRESIDRLLRFVGLEGYGTAQAHMPWRTREEEEAILAHYQDAKEEEQQHRQSLAERGLLEKVNRRMKPFVRDAVAHCVAAAPWDHTDGSHVQKPTIYMSLEESIEWKAFLRSTPPQQRHRVAARRCLSLAWWLAHCKDVCPYCWVARSVCICGLIAQKARHIEEAVWGGDAGGSPTVRVTMLLHAEEVLRGTNTGHLVAALLSAPLLVWGVEDDDLCLSSLTPTSTVYVKKANGAGREAQIRHNACLYPSSDAVPLESLVREVSVFLDDAAAPSQQLDSCGSLNATSAPAAQHHVNLILLDSTWGQALSLCRHIPSSVPRTVITIDPEYQSLFTALRKRTRMTGVSTLEATSMAIEQFLEHSGRVDGARVHAATIVGMMQAYVNLQCELKCRTPPFEQLQQQRELQQESSGAVVKSRVSAIRRDESERRWLHLQASAALQQQQQQQHVVGEDSDNTAGVTSSRRVALLPPVLNYCYLCDRVIGWHRMIEHVYGTAHNEKLLRLQEATGEADPVVMPSAVAASVVVPCYERPQRKAKGEAVEDME